MNIRKNVNIMSWGLFLVLLSHMTNAHSALKTTGHLRYNNSVGVVIGQ